MKKRLSNSSRPQRLDEGFANDLKISMKVRITKGLADPMKKEEISLREATRLARTTDSWKNVLRELNTKPKRRKK